MLLFSIIQSHFLCQVWTVWGHSLLCSNYISVKLTVWPWPLTFQPENHVTSRKTRISQGHSYTKFEHFGNWDHSYFSYANAADKQTVSNVLPTLTKTDIVSVGQMHNAKQVKSFCCSKTVFATVTFIQRKEQNQHICIYVAQPLYSYQPKCNWTAKMSSAKNMSIEIAHIQ